MSQVGVREVGPDAAPVVLELVRAAFADRPPLEPPTEALGETLASLAAGLAEHGGLLAEVDGRPLGATLLDRSGPGLMLRRFGVHPDARGSGVAGALVAHAEQWARDHGFSGIRVKARVELPKTVTFWEHHGYVRTAPTGATLRLVKVFDVPGLLPTADDARRLGRRLGGLVRAGDVVLLSGDLGAGKTTLTQGLGEALGVRGEITSPTFVIARVHPSLTDGPDLVHVDAYRLGGIAELDDLDLDTSLDGAVTVVEWGADVAEGLADERLEVRLVRTRGDLAAAVEDRDPREVVVTGVGLRWLDAGLDGLFDPDG